MITLHNFKVFQFNFNLEIPAAFKKIFGDNQFSILLR